jgi:TonB family protein
MNSLVLIQAAFAMATLPPMPADTPPALPIPVAQLAQIRTVQDVIGITLLADGTKAPAQLVLPQLDNARHTLEYMRVHYPESKRNAVATSMAVAWVLVGADGKVGAAQLLTTSGHPELDSLSLNVLRMAVFKPAEHDGNPVAVWFPMPASIPAYDDLIAKLESDGQHISEAPREVAYTQKPVLLNRNQVEAAIVRIVHQLNPRSRAETEAFARARTAAGGTALVDLFINQEGAVANAVIGKSSGNTELDNHALTVARTMRFSPAKNGDQPVDAWIQVPIKFKAN